MADYEFRYSPLTGRLTGKQMIEQTEQAINQLSSLVDSAAGQVEIISTLANEANENAATALETAEEALATTGRTYITVSTQTDANNYYDSQLIYIADSTSTNIPVADTGMLEVKTNDNKTACEQVFISDSSGDAYYRNGAITSETVGDVTTYTVTWGGWSSQPASQTYVQQELTNYAPLASLDNYLPLSGGTVSGDLTVTGNTNIDGYLPLAGGTMSGSIAWTQGEIGYRTTTHTAPYEPCKQMIVSAGTVDGEWNDGNAKLALHTYDSTGTNTQEDGSFTLEASDGTDSPSLKGYPGGRLEWGGKEVERVHASGTNYIRYASGLQMCWGAITVSGGTAQSSATCTFPVSFGNTSYVVMFSNQWSTSASEYMRVEVRNLTNYTYSIVAPSSNGHAWFWLAIGYWK